MYYSFGAMNYKSKKNADGSVTVVRTPEFDTVEVAAVLPLMVILFGMMGTAYNILTLNFDAIGGLWHGCFIGFLITLVLIPIALVADLVLSSRKH